MRVQSTRLQRAAAAMLPVAAMLGLACWLPARGFGQDAEKSKTPIPPDSSTHPEATVEKRRVQTPGNPLQIKPDGVDDVSPAPSQLSNDFHDYRHLEEGPKKATGQTLPLFGYDIFRSARDLVDAQRAFVRKQSLTEFNGLGTDRTRTNRDRTTGDFGDSTEGSRGPRRSTNKKSVDDTGTEPARRRTVDPNSDDNNSDETDTNSGTTRRRQTRRGTRNSDSSQNTGSDNASDSQSYSNRDDADTEFQNAYGTPVGPISLLYRGIAASVPDNYTLSSGDVLRIRTESEFIEQKTITTTVDARGQIRLPNVGSVVVRGMTISSAEKALEIRMRPYYKGIRVSIETGLLRTMPVLVTGAAYEAGTYTVPATATAFNLLNIAGGPNDEGSLRGIEVRRQGKKVASLDIYKMITGDAQWHDVQLSAGDVIVIPPRKTRIAVSGEVLRPALYELLPNETLKDLLAYAGGIKATGLNQSVRVNTVVPGAERVIRNLNTNDKVIDQQALFDGDQVEVFSVRNRLNNRVTVEGAVDQPNDYELQPGMRIADLIAQARGPLSEAYLQTAELRRWQTDNTDMLVVIDLEKALEKDPMQNLELRKWDRLKVYTREEVAWTGRRKVYVEGAVKKPGVYDLSKNMHVSDLLRMAGGPTPDAELERAFLLHHHDDGAPTNEYVNVAAAIKGDPNRDPQVMDSDRLIIYNVEQASYTAPHYVEIKGEVVNPGRYPRFSGMKISDLMAYAGGFKPSASNQVVLAHARRVADSGTKVVSINFDTAGRCAAADDVPLEDGDVVSVKGVGGYQPEVQSITVKGAVKNPGVIFLKSKDMRLSDAIREAGGLRPEAFPEGAQFYRNPKMLATSGQRSLVQNLAALNDLLNESETKRLSAKAQLELITATGNAISDSTGLAALTGGGAAVAAANPAAGAVAGNLSGQQLVSPARKLGSGQLDPNGIVAVDLRSALAHPKGSDDIILVDGDEINVEETPTTVYVFGAVNSGRGILFEPGKRLEYYLDQAGGVTPDAAKDRIEIFHMDGGVIPGKRAKELRPGDYVLVPTRVLAAKIAGKGNGFDSIFKSLTSSAIVFKLATSLFGL